MGTYKISELGILDDNEVLARFVFGRTTKADDFVHYIRQNGKSEKTYMLLLSAFNLRPDDDGHLSIHYKLDSDKWEKFPKPTHYVTLVSGDVRDIKTEVIESGDINSKLSDDELLNMFDSPSGKEYGCLPTDIKTPDATGLVDETHGGIFFVDYNEYRTLEYNELDELPLINNNPIIMDFKIRLLKSVKKMHNSKGGEIKFV